VGKYELGKTLGEGTFGKVRYAEHTESREGFAIKILDKEKIQRQDMGIQIKREISLMKAVQNENTFVVHLHEVLASKSKIYLVLELVTGGELFDEIVKETKFTEDKARFYFQQLVEGVSLCHAKNVCHRDLKPENLLLDKDGNLKVSDFGLSALYTSEGEGDAEGSSRSALLHTTCGTPNYVAPEVLEDQGYDGYCADVWSMGVILYVLVSGYLPFDEANIKNLFQKIRNADFLFPPHISAELRNLIGAILVADPKQRVTVRDIRNHPWFNCQSDYSPTSADKESISQPSHNSTSCMRKQFDLASIQSMPSVDGGRKSRVVRSASDSHIKREYRFNAHGSMKEIGQNLKTILEEMECDTWMSESSHKIRASRMTPKGMIGVTIQIVQEKEDSRLQLVEIRR